MKGFSATGLFELYEKSQWWDNESLMAYQRRMLSALVFHAHANAPFYRFRLAPLFSNRGDIQWNEWRNIPTIGRLEVSRYFNTMQSTKVPVEHMPVALASTSGSTGQPVTVATTNFLREIILATGWRAQRWYGVDWSLPLLTRNYVGSEKRPNGENVGAWGPPNDKAARKGRNYYCHDVTHDEVLDLMVAKRPAYVSIYSGSIDILCDVARSRKADSRVKLFFSRGGAVTDDLRAKAFDAFTAGIFEGYSTQECGSIAYTCPTGNGLHINAESVFVEIIRDDGEYAMPGEEGKVIVTPFASTAMPLIRYDLGDRAVVGEPCACGRRLPLLKSLSGKITHTFRHPDGRVHFGARVGRLRSLMQASRWQVAQTGPTQFEIRYVSDHDNNADTLTEFTNQFRALMFSDAEIGFKRVREIPFSKSGKFIEYVDEFLGPAEK